MARAALPEGDEAIKRLRAALETRPISRVRRKLPKKRIDPHKEARVFWSERAWSEMGAIPAMAQTSLALVREEHSTDAIDVLARIQSDEVRHTELSRDLANAFGGYVTDIPEGSSYAPALLAQPLEDSLGFWIVGNGCLSETISLELMKARIKYTTHPVVRPVLNDIMKDEAMHARLCWILAEQVLPTLDRKVREELGEFGRSMLTLLARTFSPTGLPPAEKKEARRIRRKVTEAGLGAGPPDEEDAAFFRVRDQMIRPRLLKLGVEL